MCINFFFNGYVNLQYEWNRFVLFVHRQINEEKKKFFKHVKLFKNKKNKTHTKLKNNTMGRKVV